MSQQKVNESPAAAKAVPRLTSFVKECVVLATEYLENIPSKADILCATPAISVNDEAVRKFKLYAAGFTVDEAANMTRPDLYCVWGNTLSPCFIFGDPKQLPPAVMMLNDRWPMYPDVPFTYDPSRSIDYSEFKIGLDLELFTRAQYPDLGPDPAGTLKPFFIHCEGARVFKDAKTRSKRSPGQVVTALDFIVDFVVSNKVNPSRISMVAPYAANVDLINGRVKGEKYKTVLANMPKASTINSFQGQVVGSQGSWSRLGAKQRARMARLKLIEASSDIVGTGVVRAFFMTASITIIAVVVTYLSNAIDEDLLNSLDHMVINWGIKSFPWTHKPDGKKLEKDSPALRASPQWKEAVEHFILALSDQQLVTGLAILTSGIANQNSLIGYEFTVMTCLAWFSSTTHLATMDALRSYFRDHPTIRNIRVIGIVCVLLLLVYAFAITANVAVVPGLRTLPVECLLSDRTYHSYDSALPLFSWILASVLIIIGYVSRVADLYPENPVAKFVFTVTKPDRKRNLPSESATSPATAERGSGPLEAGPKHFKRLRKVLRIVIHGYLDKRRAIGDTPIDRPSSDVSQPPQPYRTHTSRTPRQSQLSEDIYDSSNQTQLPDTSSRQQTTLPDDIHDTADNSRATEHPLDAQVTGDDQALPLDTQDLQREQKLQDSKKQVYWLIERKVGLRIFLLSIVGSILLGVFLNGAAMTSNTKGPDGRISSQDLGLS
ncbi:DNA helicase [Fusarium longipes]|uniref:DNA helicase n=1 Tax=Fusarium longipes TaxID=694270 RepID=A0A395T2Q7_9HYPO|nr:DNA helicase [Fusarium longipes]